MRLIDADFLLSYTSDMEVQTGKKCCANAVKTCIDEFFPYVVADCPTIDPETLPVVKQLRAELAKVKAEKDEYKELFFSYKHVCGGIAPQRIGELVEADKDGRCVIFPCRPSDVTVYQLRNKKHARGIGVHPRHIHCATVWENGRYQFEHQGMEPCKGKDLGKTWFLTEEAAEAALAKEEGQCDVK